MEKLDFKVKKLIDTVKECAREVYRQLGPGWNEKIYQKAMEVALRERKITYETQRILPITFSDHVVGESIPDLVIWLPMKGKRIAIVIDLKWEPYLKAEHHSQVAKYIQELKKSKFKILKKKTYNATEYYASMKDLIFLLKNTPIIPDFDIERDEKFLKEIEKKYKTKKGIKTNSFRFLIICKKPVS